MKKLSINSLVLTLIVSLSIGGFSLGMPPIAHAATDPGLGAASTFSVLGQTAVTSVPTSAISGDVGLNTVGTNYSGLTSAEVAGTIYDTNGTGPDGASAILPAAVQANASTAFTSNIPGQGTSGSIGPVLDSLTVTPGVWDIGAGRLNGGVLTLNGPGIYIFRASSDFISSGTITLTNGARACDVFWRVETLATINGSSFVGTILAGTGVHFGANVALNGRALAVGGDVTMISNTISGPTCAAAAAPGAGAPSYGTITVIKTVINDNGRTKTVADFPLFVNNVPVVSGVTNSFQARPDYYRISETSDPNYTQSFSGDCGNDNAVAVLAGRNSVCVVTNNDIGAPIVVPPVPPLIAVVKVPNPLSLPSGPGPVTYTYTVRNIGMVSMNNVTMVGDTCSPINLISGDINSNAVLEVSETWIYRCTTTLSASHTNTVVATGWANGISAVDIASATVVVGAPIVPPLINVTKVPSPLALPFGGGMVTYTKKVTNPGVVALSNVIVTDDKCKPLRYVSGDTDSDSKLDTTETWTYTCQMNLTQTMTNTATASGEANGLIVRDFAVATVVVANAAPTLPTTGSVVEESVSPWVMALLAGFFVAISTSVVFVLRKRML